MAIWIKRIIMYYRAENICKSKMYENNCIEVCGEETEVLKVLLLYIKLCNTMWWYTVIPDSIKPQETTKEQNKAIVNKPTKQDH